MTPSPEPVDLLLPSGHLPACTSARRRPGPPRCRAPSTRARAETSAQGVHYAGRPRHSGARDPGGDRARRLLHRRQAASTSRPGTSCVKDIAAPAGDARGGEQRVLRRRDRATASRASSTISGRERIHVVITLRPLAKIVPSQWQQYVQSGMRGLVPDLARRGCSASEPGRRSRRRSGAGTVTTTSCAAGSTRSVRDERHGRRRRRPRPRRCSCASSRHSPGLRERHAGRRPRRDEPVADAAGDRGRARVQRASSPTRACPARRRAGSCTSVPRAT